MQCPSRAGSGCAGRGYPEEPWQGTAPGAGGGTAGLGLPGHPRRRRTPPASLHRPPPDRPSELPAPGPGTPGITLRPGDAAARRNPRSLPGTTGSFPKPGAAVRDPRQLPGARLWVASRSRGSPAGSQCRNPRQLLRTLDNSAAPSIPRRLPVSEPPAPLRSGEPLQSPGTSPVSGTLAGSRCNPLLQLPPLGAPATLSPLHASPLPGPPTHPQLQHTRQAPGAGTPGSSPEPSAPLQTRDPPRAPAASPPHSHPPLPLTCPRLMYP